MPPPHPLRSTAITLGIIGIAAIAAGILVAVTAERGLSEPLAGIFIRVGAVLAAIALILPTVRRPSLGALAVVSGATILVIARPALIWVALAGGLVWLFVRQRKTDNKDS